MSTPRHFLTLLDFSPRELADLIARASPMKREHREGSEQPLLRGKVLGMIFETRMVDLFHIWVLL